MGSRAFGASGVGRGFRLDPGMNEAGLAIADHDFSHFLPMSVRNFE
jgi:hypothetical protein